MTRQNNNVLFWRIKEYQWTQFEGSGKPVLIDRHAIAWMRPRGRLSVGRLERFIQRDSPS